MTRTNRCSWFGLLLSSVAALASARAEYHYFNTPSGSDGVVQEVRWPYWNSGYYNTWLSQNWTSSEGVGGYFYSGLALPAAGSPDPVGTDQTVNWSFWPLSNPLNNSDTITPVWASPNTFSMQTIGEGTIARAPGKWRLWRTNVWYRFAFRTWQPVAGPAHTGYAAQWMRDPASGIWYHLATVKVPFAVTGINGLMGFQENYLGSLQPQRTDYRNCYYHKNGTWSSANQFWVVDHAGATENAGLIEGNTAFYYETCNPANIGYTGRITNVWQRSPTYTATQPAQPTFDPILVTNCGAVVSGPQLLVHWQVPQTSSPQFACRIEVFTNARYAGNAAVNFYDIDPEARQELLNIAGVATAYVRLSVIDIFGQTNGPIALTPADAGLNSATNVSGAVNGLDFAYYESASNIYGSGGTNWAVMPDFSTLKPVYRGAVNGLDLTPRRRRNGYAFNYTGYLLVPSNGLYAFTLNSDAGSKLYVDGQLVVDWDGLHSPSDLSGWVGLQAGYHALNVQYFCDTQPTSLFRDYFDTLTLKYEGPGIATTVVPDSAFFRVPGGGEPLISLASPVGGSTVAGASVPVSATVTPSGATIDKVQFYVGQYYWGQDAGAPYDLNAFLWAAHQNPLRARLFYDGTNILDSAVDWVSTTNLTLAPWQLTQAFYHNQPSGGSVGNGTCSLIGDGFNLLTRQVDGDCTLIAHLAGSTSTAPAPDGSIADGGWQAGIILRGNTNMVPGYPWGQANSTPFTAVFGEVNGGAYYQDETMVNGGGGYSSGNLGGQKWFRLQRAGNTFLTSVSSDGMSWTTIRKSTLADFGSKMVAGFFTYAGPSSNPNVHWARFDHVSLTGNIVGPPTASINPQTRTAYAGQNMNFAVTPSGAAPFTYQWEYNGVTLPGATNSTLTWTNLQPGDSGHYAIKVSNPNGAGSATARLAVLTPPVPVSAVLSNSPVGYWRLNEAAGPTAVDSVSKFDGTGEGGVVFGSPGVTAAPFPAYESGNLAAQFNGTDADISLPAFNLSTTNFTITGWVKCDGPQTSWAGLVFGRSGGRGTGLMMANQGPNLQLRYSWNDDGADYNWSSGLNLPTGGLWAFIALTVEPTRAIVYLGTNSVLRSATNNVTNVGQLFSGNFCLGYDPNSSSRRLKGSLDEVAIYNRTLSPAQVHQIFAAAQVARLPEVNLTSPADGSQFAAGATIDLAATVNNNTHSVSGVQFFSGTNLLGASAAPPYTFAWNGVPAGTHTVWAQAIYDGTNAAGSPPATIEATPVPSEPASVTATALAGNLVKITWPAADYAEGYILSRDGVPIAALAGIEYLDLGLSAGGDYCYTVVATNRYGSSAPSSASCVNTPVSGDAVFWDVNNATTGAQDGDGTWDGNAVNWWNGARNMSWTDGQVAVFGSGTATNCTVSITSDVTPLGMIFNPNNGGAYSLSSSGGAINLVGTASITADNDVTVGAYLKGGGALLKSGPGTLSLTVANTNTGAVIVNGGRLISTVSCWYSPRGIGSGNLVVSNGAVAEFTGTHGFGADASGRSAQLLGGTLQFDRENYVSGLTLNGGSLIGAGEMRTRVVTYVVTGAREPSLISTPVNLYSSCGFNVADGAAAVDLLATGGFSGSGGFTKTGAGVMRFDGVGSYLGPTLVNSGTLWVDGSLGHNSVTVANGATLGGNGAVGGTTTIQAGGTLSPGTNSISGMLFNQGLNLAGVSLLEIGKQGTNLTHDLVNVSGTLAYGGILNVTNLGPDTLVAGDSFQLFSAASYSGSFTATNLPALPPGLGWVWTPATGTLSVVSLVSTTPPNLDFTVATADTSLRLSWPADHIGWRLQSQTNILAEGLGADWSDVAGATATNQITLSMGSSNAATFYRLVFP